MPDYRAMYAVLFSKITSIIEDLQNVQRQTEEMHISSRDQKPDLRVINIDKVDKGQSKE